MRKKEVIIFMSLLFLLGITILIVSAKAANTPTPAPSQIILTASPSPPVSQPIIVTSTLPSSICLIPIDPPYQYQNPLDNSYIIFWDIKDVIGDEKICTGCRKPYKNEDFAVTGNHPEHVGPPPNYEWLTENAIKVRIITSPIDNREKIMAILDESWENKEFLLFHTGSSNMEGRPSNWFLPCGKSIKANHNAKVGANCSPTFP